MADEPQGFLGRWARRKTEVLQGKPLAEPPAPAASAAAAPEAVAGLAGAPPSLAKDASPAAELEKAPEKLLSLEDVKALTQDSDFKPFMARTVGPEVRNAAMKKLFADPHFNVMDGLDIYIDDYSKSDPIPESMLRQMVGAKLLKIFDDDEEDKKNPQHQPDGLAAQGTSQSTSGMQNETATGPADNPNNPTPETVAQSSISPDPPTAGLAPADLFSQPEPLPGSGASQHDHAHSHLRLQPDHASPAPSAGDGAA